MQKTKRMARDLKKYSLGRNPYVGLSGAYSDLVTFGIAHIGVNRIVARVLSLINSCTTSRTAWFRLRA